MEVSVGDSLRVGARRRSLGTAAVAQRAAGRGLHPSAVTAFRPCGEAARSRARSSLDFGAVAPGALHADWPAGRGDVSEVWLVDSAAGFRGRLGRSGPFLFL